jgi:manganese/zinc/iron transport system ATP- binding protein
MYGRGDDTQSLKGESAAVPCAENSPLCVHGLTVAYRQKPVLWQVDFEAPAGGLVAIVGPNGAGKSTFIKSVLGIVQPLSGRIEVFGKPISRMRRRVGYVPQRTSVDWDFPTTALDVVTMGLYGRIGWLRPVTSRHRRRAMHFLEQMGMAGFAHRQIGQLSGGQQQRVFLARALAQDADLYLMDEPLAGVDAATERAVIGVLRGLQERGRTVIAVHHDLETVPDYFDHVMVLNVTVISAGAVAGAFTQEALEAAYGGRMPSHLTAGRGR